MRPTRPPRSPQPARHHKHLIAVCYVINGLSAWAASPFAPLSASFEQDVAPLLDAYCLDCHDQETREGEFDLAPFRSLNDVRRNPAAWQLIARQLAHDEMPPEKSKQPTNEEQTTLASWVQAYLEAEAHANAGDPGPVVLRRLSNAEYTYSIRDLTGIDSLDPAREFPSDNAAGEGFTNVGAAMVMSPALLQKYLVAARQVAAHVVLLPDGIRFSRHTSARDETDTMLQRIRTVYHRYTTNGGGMSVDLQGIKFTTNQGGVLPLEPYLTLVLRERDRMTKDPTQTDALAQAAELSPIYLRLLWAALNDEPESKSLMGQLRSRWQTATVDDVPALVRWIEQERLGLWKYNKVGATGLAGKPKRWLQAVERESSLPSTKNIPAYLAALIERERGTAEFREASLDPSILDQWTRFASLSQRTTGRLPDLFTTTFTNAHGHETVNGWGPSQTPNLLANHGTETARFLTLTVPPRSVCIHPSPKEDAVIAWRSPIKGHVALSGLVADADEKCGNGVAWRVELRKEGGTRILSEGRLANGGSNSFSPDDRWSVQKGDVVALIIQSGEENHVCDSTHVDLEVIEHQGDQHRWHIGEHLVDDIVNGNPKNDHYGHQAVWHLGRQPHVARSARTPTDPDLQAWKTALRQAQSMQEFEQLAAQLTASEDKSATFRQLFPPTLCYEPIVPVDEVVTLTLFHREDDLLQRLMLNDTERAELDRLWEELYYISQEPSKYLVAFEQISEFATQDNPKGVEALRPHRAPTEARAANFRQHLLDTEPAHLRAVLDFATRAWRHPLSKQEQAGLRSFYRTLRAEPIEHEEAIRLTLARVLTAPHFLYRADQPAPGKKAADVSAHELATRLSYFLWSSTPDEALRQAADTGALSRPQELRAQLQRMLADERVERLAELFACQWLGVYAFDDFDEKNEELFPEFAKLRPAMYAETVSFFTHLFREDQSVLGILDADASFLTPQLAAFYGLPSEGPDPQEVTGLHTAGRGGVLGMASILAKHAGASRSSPILRGNWVYETLLGEHLPKPPKDVPLLPEQVPAGLTARQLFEQHSADPACATCHAKIDPYGFALEGFDAIGRAHTTSDVDALLPDGTRLSGITGLRAYLTGPRRDDFVQQFCQKLLGYALGRSVQLSDQPLLKSMNKSLTHNQYRISIALEQVVTSPQFRQVRGGDFETQYEEQNH